MASNYTRRINLYINGKEIKNELSSIKGEMNKISNAQAHMAIGSREYQNAANKIRTLKTIIQNHNQDLKAIGVHWRSLTANSSIADYESALGRLSQEQKKMTVGSSNYIAASSKIKELSQIIDAHNAALKNTGTRWDQLNSNSSLADYKSALKNLQTEQEKMAIGSQEYINHTKKIKQIDEVIQYHADTLKDLNVHWHQLSSNSSLADYKSALHHLTAEQEKMTIGSQEYISHTDKIQQLNQVIEHHKDNLKEVGVAWGTLSANSSITDYKSALLRLEVEQDKMAVGSQNYISHAKKIQSLNKTIAAHNAQLKQTTTGWERLVQQTNKLQGMLQAVVVGAAAFVGMVAAGKKAVTMFAEFDDKVANVARTTGLTKQEIYAISESLKKVDTRTAQLDLMNLGVIAGKLGIAKEDVLGFIKAADKLNVAFSGALGTDTEEVVNQIGKLVSVFKIEEKFGIETSMLKIGSALTTLGNASTANEGYIVEFSKRVGGIAPIVGVSIQNVMGLAATLDQLGQTSEVSSTVYSAMVTGMFKKTAEYANIAGMSVEGFKKILAMDTNFAFIKVLEGLNGNNAGMERMVALMGDMGIEGKRGIQVLGVLSNNTKMLREQQTLSNDAFYKGNAIYTSFNLLNDSAQAKLAKAGKKVADLAVELGQKLMPVLTVSTSGFSYFIKTVSASIDFFFKHSKAITTVTLALVAYGVTVKAISVWETIRQTVFTKGLILSNLEAIAIRLRILLTRTSTAAQMESLAATKAMNAAMASSLWGALAAGIVIATMALINFVKNANKVSEAQEAINNAIDQSVEKMTEQTANITLLVSLVNSENVSLAGKKKAIEDLKALIPGYNALLNDQGKILYQNTGAVKEYIVQLRRQYMLEAFKEEYQKASVNVAKTQEKQDQLVAQYTSMPGSDTQPSYDQNTSENTAKGDIKDEIAETNKLLKEQETVIAALQNKIEGTMMAIEDLPGKINKISGAMINISKALQIPGLNKEALELLNAQLLELYKKKQELVNQQKGIVPPTTAKPETPFSGNDSLGGNSTGSEAAKAAEDAYKQYLDIQKQYNQSVIGLMKEGTAKELAELKQKYFDEKEEIEHNLKTNTDLTKNEKITLNKTLKNLEDKYKLDKQVIQDTEKINILKFEKELIDLQLEAAAKGSEQENFLLLQQINNNREIELAGITETGKQKEAKQKAINAKYNKLEQSETDRYINQYLDEVLTHDAQVLSETQIQNLKSLSESRAAGKISKKQYNKELLQIQNQYVLDSLQLAINHAQDELDILVASGEDTTQAQEALNALKIKKQEETTQRETGTTKETGVLGLDKGKSFGEMSNTEIKDYSIDQAATIADTIFQIERDKNQRILDEKLTALNTLRDAELSNKHLTEKQKDAINAKYLAKEKALKTAAWKKQHQADVIQAIVSAALAVIKAAPNIPLMVAAGIAGAASIAIVSSQKAPEFLEGGFTQADANNNKAVGFVHANEYVIPAAGVNNPKLRPFLDTLEMARLNKSLPTLNPALLGTGSRFFSAGGYTQNPITASQEQLNLHPSSTIPFPPELFEAMKEFTQEMKQIRKNGIRGNWSLFDLEKIQKNKSQLESATEM